MNAKQKIHLLTYAKFAYMQNLRICKSLPRVQGLKGYQELFFILISFFNKKILSKQNSPRFAASHLDLFCLPMSHKMDDRLVIWVKYFNQNPVCYHVCVIIEHIPIIRPRLCSQLTTCTIHIGISEHLFFKVVQIVASSPWSLMP